ncbi:ABC transporter permease [Streptacidiphilus jiangxiensis]|uniref:ABC-2 type transport system permease protein n=1 Tax=Streptacidiphilus jiangxiensis TaxID=235985 RepID=A0A1H7M7B5_STRJI|nr:ABC transporter permease [Streptacidiphilus jiangxiensis]SEL07094.1 ABC-2 type transport system permease protein [Streptacidiphilus jiangxiensis]
MTTVALPAAPMTRKGFTTLTAVQARLLLREPAALAWLAVPVVVVLVLGSIPGFRTPQAALGGQRVIDVYVPTCAAMVPLFLALTALPVTFASYREKAVLRRLSVSPVPAAGVLGALVTVIAALAAVGVLTVVAIGALVFDVKAPAHPAAALAGFVLGGAAVLALGLVVAARARTAGAASGLGVPLMVLNFFAAGLYVPVAELPQTLQRVCEFVPFGAVTAIWSGHGPLWQHLLVLAGWTVAGGLAAVRFFRWE